MAWQQALDPSNWKIDWWTAYGLLGNMAFSCRFMVQWIASERAGRTVVPMAFWYLSIVGCVIMLTYSVFGRQDLVVMLGYVFNLVPYLRNVVLTRRYNRQLKEAPPQEEALSGSEPQSRKEVASGVRESARSAPVESGV